MTRFKVLASGFVLLLALPGIGATVSQPVSASNQTPKLFRMFPDAPYPYWVDASQAVDANDYVHGEYFFDEGRTLKAWMATPEENGCIPIGIAQPSLAPDSEHPQVRDTLKDAVGTSIHIVQATVVDQAVGFASEIPGTLLTLRLDKTLKGGQAPSTFHIFMPVGDVPFGRKQICKSDANYIPIPRVGDQIVIFTLGFGGEGGRLAIVGSGADIVSVARDGRLTLPIQYTQSVEGRSGISSLRDLSHAIEVDRHKAQDR